MPPDGDVVVRGGHRCTAEVRTALDVVRLEPLTSSVPLLDAMLARAIVARPELEAAAGRLPSDRRCRWARQAVSLADERAESPPEPQLRVLLTPAGLPPVPQWRVRRPDGVFLARVDLAYPDAELAVEYDGVWHGRPRQLIQDRRRLDSLVSAGWRVLHVTVADLRRPTEVVARVGALLSATEIGGPGR